MVYVIDNIEKFVNRRTSGQHQIIVCKQRLNSFRHINQFLTTIHASLKPHGLFIGRVETLEKRKEHQASRYKYFCYRAVVIYEFIFRRVLPRLPLLRLVYRITKITKHRILSKCEALGRLTYCGFDIVAFTSSAHDLCFVVRKNAQPENGKPHSGVFIRILKVGRNGKTIYCHKLRTMHAYADYLHDYILSNHEIDSNGKIIDDFRKTGWGKLLRKTWLDEMPQLYNVLKGDISFIGLRPLSREFLQLYPDDWREERQKMKPGFVPPYYADCPRTFEEIIESEKRYSRFKQRHPFTTDMIYFLRVVYSFLSGKARTG